MRLENAVADIVKTVVADYLNTTSSNDGASGLDGTGAAEIALSSRISTLDARSFEECLRICFEHLLELLRRSAGGVPAALRGRRCARRPAVPRTAGWRHARRRGRHRSAEVGPRRLRKAAHPLVPVGVLVGVLVRHLHRHIATCVGTVPA